MPKSHYKPDSFHLRDSIGYLIKRSQRLMQERIEGLFEQQNFTLQQWAVLMYLRDGLATTTADMCRNLHHDSGAMTRLVDQLESRKLIERRRSADDRRVVELSLTEAGAEVLDTLIPTACDALNSALDGFTREEVKTLQSMLRRLIGRMEELMPNSAAASDKEKVS
ncbi:MarR family winged helix-turn-helix transcriptional regulator [Steroidobacter agaridevorans]|uniref:MarR family winged helix-turn-helix transcriptional regulator n=1 Tax=Steroidobacter agaridevorans TaxID=2695856 RepID=UPI001329CC0C|nr:MarR family winged helix-turn-helix transcriptional regulator [Steroidobacter agaridevorans]GFE88100.1 MarR family transcriptional regulator [Steroidobacter agaridevorans]